MVVHEKNTKIYIILTYTGTILSKIIKIFTRDEFAHVSISLDVNLKEMYSFGRLNPYNPFIGGFVHEYMDKGTFKRFSKTNAQIYCLELTEKQVKAIKNIIVEINKDRLNYKFNLLGLFAIAFKIRIKRRNHFYCAEFVKYVLDEAKVHNELPEMIRPEDFKSLKGLNTVYSGLLREYKYN